MPRSRQRILYHNHTGNVSGAELVLLSILEGLDRCKYDPIVICPMSGDLSARVAALEVPCMAIPEMNARFTWNPLRLIGYLVSTLQAVISIHDTVKEIDPDFIHANTVRAGIASTIATSFTARTVIWHVHDVLPQHPITSCIRALALISPRVRIIAVSHAACKAFSGQSDRKLRLETIHNGVDLTRFPRKSPGVAPLKRDLSLPQDAFLICAVGQICARKGLRELLKVFAALQILVPELHLAIVGKPVFRHDEVSRNELLQLTESLHVGSCVHFTGHRSDIAEVLQSADLLVLNSLEEPFGLVLVEAMSSGTPVMATRVGGIPEIVTDGETGWLVDAGDTDQLSSRLLELLMKRELLSAVAQRAYDEVCPRFTLQRFLLSIHSYYASLPESRVIPTTQKRPVEGGHCV